MSTDSFDQVYDTDLEIGITEAIRRHVARHVAAPKPVSQRKLNFEECRPRWLRECMTEATGVFFYVFPGIAATASFAVSQSNPVGSTASSNLFTIGWAFGLGITFAIITCAPTSGGHFNPAITICLWFWQGFPLQKVPYYIVSQVFGAFIAGLMVMGMYWPEISAMKAEFIAAGKPLVGSNAPASILCTFPDATQTNMGYVIFTEFFVDSFVGIIIWACLDFANPFVSPISAPFIIGLGYGAMVWGFGAISISTNLARDLGTRVVAAIFFGGEAFSYKDYSAISILVNIPATLFATGYYEMLMRDSILIIGKGHSMHEGGEEGLMRHLKSTTTGLYEDR
ncbi:hypothetical protein PLIIFM63780_002240 [Purpureocillium lilacinum]|nr:hypothetical protein PLIIFM63780_002240 [Purpureocillium lilacinum]